MGTRLTDVILVVSSAHYSRASEVISCLDRVHQLKKHEVKPSSLYLRLILEQVRVCVCVCVCEERERGGWELESFPSSCVMLSVSKAKG